MPLFIQLFRTSVSSGVAVSDSELIIVALYAPGETIDPNDGAALRIVDQDGDGLISRDEFRDATGGGGLGRNAGSDVLLFDGEPGGGGPNGDLYSPAPVSGGTDLNSFIDDLDSNFAPADPEAIETDNPDQPPSDDPTDDAPVICFTKGTLIKTKDGQTPIEELQIGDLVATADRGFQRIRWIGKRRVGIAELKRRPNIRPIRIETSALGPDIPDQVLWLSPQHRVLAANRVVERMFSVGEVL